MEIFYCVLILLALVLPLHWAVMLQLAAWESPGYFRRFGVIVRRPEAIEGAGEPIGTYDGAPIRRWVRFKGMRYEFSGIVAPRYQRRIAANELYLEPGLLYLAGTEDEAALRCPPGRPGETGPAARGGACP
jgi:hypothetical protein